MTRSVAISVLVTTNNPGHIYQATEALTRVACGLALDGIETELMTGPAPTHDHSDTEDQEADDT